jgi:LysM repeat protein
MPQATPLADLLSRKASKPTSALPAVPSTPELPPAVVSSSPEELEEATPPEAAPIPEPSGSTAQTPGIHVFRTGESLVSIASRHGLTLDELVAANDLPPMVPVADGTRLMVTLQPSDGTAESKRPDTRSKRR